MSTIFRRYAKEVKEVKAILENKGYSVTLYGDDGYSMKTDEFGIDSVRTDDSVKNTPETRFSVWMKDNGRILVNVGIKTALYNTFVYGGYNKEERATIHDRKSDNERKERSLVFTNYSVFKRNIDMIPSLVNAVQDVDAVKDVDAVNAVKVVNE